MPDAAVARRPASRPPAYPGAIESQARLRIAMFELRAAGLPGVPLVSL